MPDRVKAFQELDPKDRANVRPGGRPKADENLYTEENDVKGFPSGNKKTNEVSVASPKSFFNFGSRYSAISSFVSSGKSSSSW